MKYSRAISKNYTSPCFGLKMDVRKFFDNIDHAILLAFLREEISDANTLNLLQGVISSFEAAPGRGLPLGNLTSQLFANIYMDRLDKFVKHRLKAKHYLRYADDFLVLGTNPDELMGYFIEINLFLKRELKLSLHPNKISLRKLSQGIDFVGYVARSHYSVPRRKTIDRMQRRIGGLQYSENLPATINSYLGYLSHVSAHDLSESIK